jgi:hypothetical protein
MYKLVRPPRHIILQINNLELHKTYPNRSEQNRDHIIQKPALPIIQLAF